MAQKPYIMDQQQRERRHQSYLAAPVVAKKFPGVEELSVAMRFTDPDGKVHPSPHKRLFAPEMQAFFEFQCPLRDCVGGGFNLTTAIPKAFSNRRGGAGVGKMSCQGRRPREGVVDQTCRLELTFQVTSVDKRKVAA